MGWLIDPPIRLSVAWPERYRRTFWLSRARFSSRHLVLAVLANGFWLLVVTAIRLWWPDIWPREIGSMWEVQTFLLAIVSACAILVLYRWIVPCSECLEHLKSKAAFTCGTCGWSYDAEPTNPPPSGPWGKKK